MSSKAPTQGNQDDGKKSATKPGLLDPAREATCLIRLLVFLKVYWKTVVIIGTPIVLSPILLIHNTKDYRCLWGVGVVGVMWMTEAMPHPVASLLPVLLFPLLSVLPSAATAQCYMSEAIVTMICCVLLVEAVIASELHIRVGLLMVMACKYTHTWLTFGFGMCSLLLTIFLPSPAVVSMLLSTIKVVLEVLEEENATQIYETPSPPQDAASNAANTQDRRDSPASKDDDDDEDEDREGQLSPARSFSLMAKSSIQQIMQRQEGLLTRMENVEYIIGTEKPPQVVPKAPRSPSDVALCYYLLIAYTPNFAVLATMVGTGGNQAIRGIFHSLFPAAPTIEFPVFMLHSLPVVIIMELLIWLYFQVFYLGLFRPNSAVAKAAKIHKDKKILLGIVIKRKYADLGAVSYHQIIVMLLVVLSVTAFFFRKPLIVEGWSHAFSHQETGYSSLGAFLIVLMFLIPRDLNFLTLFSKELYKSDVPERPSHGLLLWSNIQETIPWGLVYFMGAGFAISAASNASGAHKLVGRALMCLGPLPHPLYSLLPLLLCKLMAECFSSLAVMSLMLPVLAHWAVLLQQNPLLLMMSGSLGSCLVFHFQAGSPTNVLACQFANITQKQMLLGGVGPSLLCLTVMWLTLMFWTPTIWPSVLSFPLWAQQTANTTDNFYHYRLPMIHL